MATILLVDDDPVLRILFAHLLQELGYTAIPAADGALALELLQTTPVDLVLTDLSMPILDGVALIRAIRSRAAWRQLPIVVMSAYLTGAPALWRGEVSAVLEKPVRADELETVLAQALGG